MLVQCQQYVLTYSLACTTMLDVNVNTVKRMLWCPLTTRLSLILYNITSAHCTGKFCNANARKMMTVILLTLMSAFDGNGVTRLANDTGKIL